MSKLRLLQASVDPEDICELRILANGQNVKYLTIDPGVYPVDELCFAPLLFSVLPPLPPGDWNQGHISRDPTTRAPKFVCTTREILPAVTHTWHSLYLDHLELNLGEKLRSNVYEGTCPRFKDTVVVKFACWPWQIDWLDQETQAYQWIDGHNIGPKFLAHLTEEGRVIGFVMERISDAQHAKPEHLPLCQEVLQQLHRLGIKHGDVNKHNFLVQKGVAKLIDFDHASQCGDVGDLNDELLSLEKELHETSGRGGRAVVVNDG